jgi:quinoprotein glucose dehydrogenase
MTYEANGRQYVVIMAGGHHFMETPIGDALVADALPPRKIERPTAAITVDRP